MTRCSQKTCPGGGNALESCENGTSCRMGAFGETGPLELRTISFKTAGMRPCVRICPFVQGKMEDVPEAVTSNLCACDDGGASCPYGRTGQPIRFPKGTLLTGSTEEV